MAVSASFGLTCKRIPRLMGHSSLVMFVSARKHSIPADSRQPLASSASDMLPKRRMVTSSGVWGWFVIFRHFFNWACQLSTTVMGTWPVC
jgi:hypothetical protein